MDLDNVQSETFQVRGYIKGMDQFNFSVPFISIDDYRVYLSNSCMVTIYNRVSFKKISIKIDSSLDNKEKIYLISKHLMMINKSKNPQYKKIFKSLLETLRFIEKLKMKINEFDLSSQEYAGSTASGIK
jgi:hypothetical protein